MMNSSTPDTTRPFGAHLRMRWWAPLVLTAVVVAATYGLQLLLGAAAAMAEVGLLGKSPEDRSLTPLAYLAVNLSIILMAPIAIPVLAKLAGVPWRAVLSAGRSFRWRRLGGYLAGFTALLLATNALVLLVEPAPPGSFVISGTTVALLAVVLLTTPLQAASEELVFRGGLTAAYASWVRAVRPAILLGASLSTVLFTVLHTSADLWMNLHYLGLGASTAAMAVLARGIEPAIAFHAASNVLAMGIGALLSAGGGISQDRSAGAAGPYMLLPIGAQALAVLITWLVERRRADAAGRQR